MSNTVIVKQRLVNEYGSGYGDRYIIFAKSDADAENWINDNFTDDERYGSRGVWDQLHFDVIVTDRHNALSDVISAFVRKGIGFATLKKIARMYPQWEHDNFEVI
jgi:hypothetical protein